MRAVGVTSKSHGDHVDAYNGTAKFLHWTIAALVAVQYITKLVPDGIFGLDTEDRLAAWHVYIGSTILAFMAVRLTWRLIYRTPPPPTGLPLIIKLLSRATHWLFYAALLLFPVLGWVAASAYGITTYLFGVIPLPALITPDERLGGRVGQAHGIMAWAMLAIIALHVAGAMYHALVRKDGVLNRMLPIREKRG